MSRRHLPALIASFALVAGFFAATSPADAASPGTISGTVTRTDGGSLSNVRIEVWRKYSGGRLSKRGDDINPNDTTGEFSTTVSSSNRFALRIVGKDLDGTTRHWWWQGNSSNSFAGGGRAPWEASTVAVKSGKTFTADFALGRVSGNVTNIEYPAADNGDIEMVVAAPPRKYSSNKARRRDMDIENCANVFGGTRTESNGHYEVGFLPDAGDQRYMVKAIPKGNSVQATWNNFYGSCYSILEYEGSRANLLAAGSTQDFGLKVARNKVRVNVDAKGWKLGSATTEGDLWVRIRERIPSYKANNGTRIPGFAIDESPIIGHSDGFSIPKGTGGVVTVKELPQGQFYVEVGRRTGCADWYGSVYSNNDAYFQGLDRSAESWKAFRTLGSLSGARRYLATHARPNPAGDAQKSKPAGKAGWMYREYCPAIGAGATKWLAFSAPNSGLEVRQIDVKKGAYVSGRVTRAGGRSNKEMMVRLTTIDGNRVLRSDITDSSGYFKVTGLAPGSYRIGVNTDSWRGISRSFSGRDSITVSSGKGYSVGTLHLK